MTDAIVPTTDEQSLAFEKDFGEPLRDVLDLTTWRGLEDVQLLYDRLEQEVAAAVAQEDRIRAAIRSDVIPHITTNKNAPPFAGAWSLTPEDIQRAQDETLFNGAVDAVRGTSFVLDSLQLTVIQLGVCLLRYRGDERTWEHRVLRRDLAGTGMDPVKEALDLIDMRARKDNTGLHQPDRVTELGTRGITAVAERAILARVATAPWRMGSGQPAPFEILSGAGAVDIVQDGLAVLRELLLEHGRYVFVQRSPRKRGLLTIGLALRPLEFAVVHYLQSYIQEMVEGGHLRGERREDALEFVRNAGREVIVGVFRISDTAPPYVFFAPADPDLCAQAATLAMADAALQEHVGYPLLLDLADRLAQEALGQRSVRAATQAAFHAHGYAPMGLDER
jgi:hypothetical protein